MSDEIRKLEPKALWNNFYLLTQVPRPSKHEDAIQAFMMKFGEDLGLETKKDEIPTPDWKKIKSYEAKWEEYIQAILWLKEHITKAEGTLENIENRAKQWLSIKQNTGM